MKLCQFLVRYMYIYIIVIFSILLLKFFLNSIHGFGFVRKEKQHLKGAGGDLWLNSSQKIKGGPQGYFMDQVHEWVYELRPQG